MGQESSWGFEEGDEIVPGRVALRDLGGGTEFEVYLAWDDRLFSIVVAKVLRPDRVEDPHSLRRLRREARVLGRLAHPVVVRAFDAVLEGDRPHLLLEHLEGPTLQSLVRKYGPLPLEQLLPLALHVCSALHYISTEGLVHLDVKPANIVMGAPPRLIDLSIARPVKDARRLRQPIGTDEYMAPEQCAPGEAGEMGSHTDVWGLGATLYRAVTGVHAFGEVDETLDDADPWAKYPQLSEDPLPFPREVPDAVAEPILHCLEKDPAERPTAAELAVSLEPLVAALPRRPVLGRRPRWR